MSWKPYRLGDLYDVFSGLSKPREEFGFGYPFLTFKDVFYNYFLPDELGSLANTSEKERDKCSVKRGDVFLTRTSETVNDLGMSCVALKDYSEATFNGFTKRLRLKPDVDVKVDPVFLGYYLRSQDFRQQVSAVSSITTRASLNATHIKALEVKLPEYDEQISIGEMLKPLDDKIELNRRMNATLEAMAQAVFKEWFVDGAKEEWKELSVYDFADVIYGAPFASKLFNTNGEGTGLIRIRELSTHEPATFTTEEHPKATLVHPGEIVVGMDGEFRVHHWRGIPALLNQRVCMFKPKASHLRAFLALSLVAPMEFYERSTVGTTVIHLGKSDIDEIRLPKPPDELLKQFGQLVEPMLEKRLANAAESRTLAALRDTLLPKLMRGEVRVKEPQTTN